MTSDSDTNPPDRFEAASAGLAFARVLVSEFASDWRRYPLTRAAGRALRKTRILGMGGAHRPLESLPAYQAHVAAMSDPDRLFFLSGRHYLANGFTLQERLDAAFVHYTHESDTFDASYVEQVYRGNGLLLWSQVKADVEYEIRLVPGKDVPTEGGLSVVFNVNGTSVCIMSYSVVATRLVIPAGSAIPSDNPLGKTIMYVARRHSSRDHSYQAKFNKAFDRVTAPHLCFGALTGIALALGHRHVLGIAPERHPAFTESLQSAFISAYADFWTSMTGNMVSPLGYLIDLPTRMTPLKDLDASKRKRALARRAHIEAVQSSTQAIIAAHLREPVAVALTPAPAPAATTIAAAPRAL